MSNQKGEYKNVFIAGIWPSKNGHYSSMPLDAKAFDELQRVVEIGGKLLIRKRSEESLAKSTNPNTPPYCLEFVPAEEVEKFRQENPRGGSRGL